MKAKIALVVFAFLLLAPTYASAQSPDRIIITPIEDEKMHGEYVWIHGKILSITPGAFVIIQITNPRGELCNIQQIVPIEHGSFVTKAISLQGNLCGLQGDYTVNVHYNTLVSNMVFTLGHDIVLIANELDAFTDAKLVLDRRIAQTRSIDTSLYKDRADSITFPFGTIVNASRVYSDLVVESFTASLLDGLDVTLRRSVSSALDAISMLETDAVLDATTASSIRHTVYSAIYYYEIGDAKLSSVRLNAAYDAIREYNTQSSEYTPPATFDNLKATLVGLIQRNANLLGPEIRDELAFILARGTAPIFATELETMLDILTQARYLEITSQKDDSLYSFVSSEWLAISGPMSQARSIESFTSYAERVNAIYDAAFLLRDLDKVERFLDSDSNVGLGEIIEPSWQSLRTTLRSASNVDDILEQSSTISSIKAISEISSRLERAITITRANNIDNELTQQWPDLLRRVSEASSLNEMLDIVDEFNNTMLELRNARNPISELRLEYRELLVKAEQQFDRTAIANIENAQSILELAAKIQSANPTAIKLDRVEVLLVWVVQQADILERQLATTSPEDTKARTSGILQRAQSLENLTEIGLRTKRFVSGYTDYIDEIRQIIAKTRSLVIDGQLNSADSLIRGATEDWLQVDNAYRIEPPTSSDYGKVDIQRREYSIHAADLQSITSKFLVAGTTESREFSLMLDRVDDFIMHGNFVDAKEWITRAYLYAQEHLNSEHNSIIFDIGLDEQTNSWLIEGFVEKQSFDRREDISVSIQTAEGKTYEQLDFIDTKHGKFHVQFGVPLDPGIYIAELVWRDTSSSNILYIPYDDSPEQIKDRQTTSGGSELVKISRDLYDLQEFMRGFGAQQYQAHVGKISPVLEDAKLAITDRDESKARQKVAEIRALVERYLPMRSPEAVISVTHSSGNLNVAGTLYKLVEFPEDIYVDVFDQTGLLVVTISISDQENGKFSHDLLYNFEPGTYAAMLSYHDIRVSDFFTTS